MRIETLRTLLKLRTIDVDAARRVLVAAIEVESVAASATSRAEMRIMEEAALASSVDAGDDTVETYARWLPVGREQVRRARAELERATQEVTVARLALSITCLDERAASTILGDAETASAVLRAKKEQDELDDAASRCARVR